MNGLSRNRVQRGVQRIRTCFGILVTIGSAVGCVPSPSDYTVAYYRANAEVRAEKLRECGNDPGALRNDPLCINAREANAMEGIGGLRRLPPIGLIESEEKAQKQRQQQQRHPQ